VSATKKAKTKTKMTLKESAAYLGKSPYMRNLLMMVVGYGMAINIVEVTWKARLKLAFPDPNAYSAFMGNFASATGAVTLVMMLASRTIFDKFGWGVAAQITPLMLLGTGAVFFTQVLFPGAWAPVAVACGTTPLMLAVLVGAAQNILSKSSKYSLFDPCKEMAYIPLDAEQKTKGKAAIDVIGNPLGKSGGSLIQQFLFVGLGSLSASTPYLGAILAVIVTGWLGAARRLSTQFDSAMAANEAAPAAALSVSAETDAAAAGAIAATLASETSPVQNLLAENSTDTTAGSTS
jgi:AAA family ATP:ADP antiporter